jgi:predicted peroxiredoxin
VDVMVNGALGKHEATEPGAPTIGQRLHEAVDMGVEIQCCTQTMANKGILQENLIHGVTPAGAMSLIDLTSHAKGSLCF